MESQTREWTSTPDQFLTAQMEMTRRIITSRPLAGDEFYDWYATEDKISMGGRFDPHTEINRINGEIEGATRHGFCEAMSKEEWENWFMNLKTRQLEYLQNIEEIRKF